MKNTHLGVTILMGNCFAVCIYINLARYFCLSNIILQGLGNMKSHNKAANYRVENHEVYLYACIYFHTYCMGKHVYNIENWRGLDLRAMPSSKRGFISFSLVSLNRAYALLFPSMKIISPKISLLKLQPQYTSATELYPSPGSYKSRILVNF